MKKILIIGAIVLLAAGCGKEPATSNQNPDHGAQNGHMAGVVNSITIEPSRKSGDKVMYGNGAVVKVVGEHVQSVEIKYISAETGLSEQSLGQATSLSSQINTWALQLPKEIMAKSMWAEAKDMDGATVKSQVLSHVEYQQPNTYKSPGANGFSIEYAKELGFSTNRSQGAVLGYLPVCGEGMAACVYVHKDGYKGTNFAAAGVFINLLKALNTEAKCYNFAVPTNPAKNEAGTATINNVSFRMATGGSAGAGHADEVTVYRNFRNGACYEIAQHVASSNIGNYEPGTVKEFNKNEVLQILQPVVQSFMFTDSASSTTKSVKVGSQVVLKKGESAKISGTNDTVTLVDFINSPCPAGAQCIWQGTVVMYRLAIAGKTYSLNSGVGTVQQAPYKITTVTTDYKTSATVKVEKLPAPAALLQVCPDAWIEDRMPSPDLKPGDSYPAYFVIKGERKEIVDYDLEWVQKNCEVNQPTIAY